jgi:hypothetical protein
MGFVEFLYIQRLPVAGVNFPHDTEVLIGSRREEIGHLVKAIVLVLALVVLTARYDEAESIKGSGLPP